MKVRGLVLFAIFILLAQLVNADGSLFSDELHALSRNKRYSNDVDDFLSRYQDSVMRRGQNEYQEYLDQRSQNDYSYAENSQLGARSMLQERESDDIYADVEYKRAIITTVPANTSVCLKGFTVDNNGDAWCSGDAYNTRRRAYEVKYF